VIPEKMVPTEAAAIIRLVQSLNGPLRVTFEESTQAAWLYEVIKAYVTKVIVCDPLRNKLLEDGSKADKVDVQKLPNFFELVVATGLPRTWSNAELKGVGSCL